MTGVTMKRFLLVAAVVASLAIVPVAAAGSSVLDAYGTNGSNAIIQVKSATAASETPATQTNASSVAPSALPFTGLDLVVIVAAGAGLALLGGGLRRLGRDKK